MPSTDTRKNRENTTSVANGENTETILVVDDDPKIRILIRKALEPEFRVEEAEDGKGGIESAKKHIPDLIVSDVMMPHVDGFQLSRALGKDIDTSHIPIVFLTSNTSEESMIEGLETGAVNYLTKPVNVKLLVIRLRNLLNVRRKFQEKIRGQLTEIPDDITIPSMEKKFLEEMVEILSKNISDPDFHVDQLAGKLYMERSGLYRKIKALTGQSPVQFIRDYRMKRASQLLKAHFGNVTEVALEVGFPNVAYFTKCFKESFNCLPSVYTKNEC